MKNFAKTIILSLLVIITLPANSSAHMGSGGMIAAILIPPLYQDESAFTQIPAGIGGLVAGPAALIVGGTGYFIGSIIGAPFNKGEHFAAKSGFYSGIGTVWLGATATGAPFYILEKTIYDAPRALLIDADHSEATNSSQNNIFNQEKTSVVSQEKTQDGFVNRSTSEVIEIKVVAPGQKCLPGTSIYQGIGKSTKPHIMNGGSLVMAHGYSVWCDQETE